MEYDPELRRPLKSAGFITRDARVKERKKIRSTKGQEKNSSFQNVNAVFLYRKIICSKKGSPGAPFYLYFPATIRHFQKWTIKSNQGFCMPTQMATYMMTHIS